MSLVMKLISTAAVLVVLGAGMTLRAPQKGIRPDEVLKLIVAIVVLYVSGALALIARRTDLGAVAFGSGLLLCAMTLWLARGNQSPPDDEPEPQPLPREPPPEIDWSFFEDQFREPTRRS